MCGSVNPYAFNLPERFRPSEVRFGAMSYSDGESQEARYGEHGEVVNPAARSWREISVKETRQESRGEETKEQHGGLGKPGKESVCADFETL